MNDIFSKQQRSLIMKSVKSNRNTSTELKLISIFKKYSIKGWQRNYKIYGKPDFVFRNKKITVFVDGCFWHGHHCRNIIPKDNSAYWDAKRKRNITRDQDVSTYLTNKGWLVIRIWECELKKKALF